MSYRECVKCWEKTCVCGNDIKIEADKIYNIIKDMKYQDDCDLDKEDKKDIFEAVKKILEQCQKN